MRTAETAGKEEATRAWPGACRCLLWLLVLSCGFDKAGWDVALGRREVSISVYKLVFPIGLAVVALRWIRMRRVPAGLNAGLLSLAAVLVGLQALAAVAGLLCTPGARTWSSEIYYLIQDAQIVFIPFLAASSGVGPRYLLGVFSAAVGVHLLAVAVQLAAPHAYLMMDGRIADPLRPDNIRLWDGRELVVVGLQRTANYGTFVAAFGLLALGWPRRSTCLRILGLLSVGASAWAMMEGHSRATVILWLVALVTFVIRTRARESRLELLAIALVVAGCCVAPRTEPEAASLPAQAPVSLPPPSYLPTWMERVPIIGAFLGSEKAGSNVGKLMIARYGWELIRRSPVVGWGHRRFADLTAPLGNDWHDTSEAHSRILAILLASGLVGFAAYSSLYVRLAIAIWRRQRVDAIIVAGMYVGLAIYNVVYDAGGLDLFACFNGVAGYYAMAAAQEGRSDSFHS